MDSDRQLQGVINFRDVGKTINDFLGKRRLREGVFYRSARLDDATADDHAVLREHLQIKTVIDLRTKTEHVEQLRRHQKRVIAGGHVQTNAGTVKPFHIEGLRYHEIRITGRPFEKFLLRQLAWWSFFKFFFLFLVGYRLQAVGIVGREVLAPRGLVGLGLDTMDQSGSDIGQTLAIYADPDACPIVVHCTQGKDRTGLICALLLMLVDVPLSAIEYDYFLTDPELLSDKASKIREVRAIGLPDDWAKTHPDMIKKIADHLDNYYGGLKGYLAHIGLSEEDQAKIRENLLY